MTTFWCRLVKELPIFQLTKRHAHPNPKAPTHAYNWESFNIWNWIRVQWAPEVSKCLEKKMIKSEAHVTDQLWMTSIENSSLARNYEPNLSIFNTWKMFDTSKFHNLVACYIHNPYPRSIVKFKSCPNRSVSWDWPTVLTKYWHVLHVSYVVQLLLELPETQ